MRKEKILIVDDDLHIRSMLRRALQFEGYEVVEAADGEEALQMIKGGEPDLLLLDLMLPKRDGWEVCTEVRRRDLDLPILMLTAKDELESRVQGFDLGADDYVVKPFELEELLARIRALLRRSQRQREEASLLHYKGIELNPEARKAWREGRPLNLKGKEFDLLFLFLKHPNQVLSKEQLIEQIWGLEADQESNVLEVYIANLRQKLEEGGEKRIIQTIRGVGYVLREE
ncbi:Response regulator MprA [[Clostridium] ultunense Esp]|uniref:response regulator transcription factor n=1 Tax=Thermicanus aegyptius TaxID=94009 RepID=UPI0002B70AC6|nr:response regulator transcription factor [Thermicanus aegyptius]CCQ94888.1 Response regulator MprA [[Clostridium] ultunense Esp]